MSDDELISIHALLAESDALRIGRAGNQSPFLSTLSLRRATKSQFSNLRPVRISIHALLAESDPARPIRRAACFDFYPRSPCGERRMERLGAIQPDAISIHALLAESDILTRK